MNAGWRGRYRRKDREWGLRPVEIPGFLEFSLVRVPCSSERVRQRDSGALGNASTGTDGLEKNLQEIPEWCISEANSYSLGTFAFFFAGRSLGSVQRFFALDDFCFRLPLLNHPSSEICTKIEGRNSVNSGHHLRDRLIIRSLRRISGVSNCR